MGLFSVILIIQINTLLYHCLIGQPTFFSCTEIFQNNIKVTVPAGAPSLFHYNHCSLCEY